VDSGENSKSSDDEEDAGVYCMSRFVSKRTEQLTLNDDEEDDESKEFKLVTTRKIYQIMIGRINLFLFFLYLFNTFLYF
jgi:hypothetical protein